MKNRSLAFLFFFFVLLSCNPKYNIIYLDDAVSEEYEDDHTYFIHLCIVFDSSMVGSKIYLKNYTTSNIVIDEFLSSTNSKIIKYKWIPNNTKDWDLKIDKFQYHIERNTYKKHKYLLIKKIKNKINLIHTNQSPIERIKVEKVLD